MGTGVKDNNYSVLLILTNGFIKDMVETKNAIVMASNLPLSIIIIGLGNGDFSSMESLDGTRVRLQSLSGIPAKRDIIHFVPFNKFAKRGQEELAAEVLRKLPTQVKEYFAMVGKEPNQPIEVNMEDAMQSAFGKGDLEKSDFDYSQPIAMSTFINGSGNPFEEGVKEEEENSRREKLKALIGSKLQEDAN